MNTQKEKSTINERQEEDDIPRSSFMGRGDILRIPGVMIAERHVDVSFGRPHRNQRRFTEAHRNALVKSMRKSVDDLLNPLIVSVDDDRLVKAARNTNNYKWPHVCEVSPRY